MTDTTTDKPFHVLTDDTFVAGYDTEEQAVSSVERRNGKAQALGLKARYRVIELASADDS